MCVFSSLRQTLPASCIRPNVNKTQLLWNRTPCLRGFLNGIMIMVLFQNLSRQLTCLLSQSENHNMYFEYFFWGGGIIHKMINNLRKVIMRIVGCQQKLLVYQRHQSHWQLCAYTCPTIYLFVFRAI